jgi:23S rRNA (pseudouridine1915-N3)-methyltransferase
MKIHLLTVGKTKEEYFRAAIAHYEKSISRLNEFIYFEARESSNDPVREGSVLLDLLKKRELIGHGRAKLVLLEVGGKLLSSKGFAEKIGKARDSGTQDYVFLIGGAYGFSSEFRQALADSERISLTPMTFTHEIARVVLCEQIYRALHILGGSKYHHG